MRNVTLVETCINLVKKTQKEEDNWGVRRKFEDNIKMCFKGYSVRMLSRLSFSG